MPSEATTGNEVETFAQKLDEFGQSLSEREQALLGAILHRAASAPANDVEGYNMSTGQQGTHEWHYIYAGVGAFFPPGWSHPEGGQGPEHGTFHNLVPGALGYPGQVH